ncbi:unnamed protein product [Citrullus colocynthis]|uniref:Uncharacterized protein n=1 Tax=Citrullus colocynthis TaxID=252529 RepID=A0ABP0Z518_9ROSI
MEISSTDDLVQLTGLASLWTSEATISEDRPPEINGPAHPTNQAQQITPPSSPIQSPISRHSNTSPPNNPPLFADPSPISTQSPSNFQPSPTLSPSSPISSSYNPTPPCTSSPSPA